MAKKKNGHEFSACQLVDDLGRFTAAITAGYVPSAEALEGLANAVKEYYDGPNAGEAAVETDTTS